MEPEFPIEFLVAGTPVSHQAKRRDSVAQWQERLKAASKTVLPDGHWLTDNPVAVTLFYFPAGEMSGDLDNIVKPILDAFTKHIYIDDSQVQRLVVQKFEPGKIFPFPSPSVTLENALLGIKPLLYVRMSSDPFEELS